MKVERKVIERGGWFFYSGIGSNIYAKSFKSSVYAGFSVVGMVYLHIYQVFL